MVNTMLMYFTTIKQTEERYFHTNFPTDFQKGKLGSLCGPPWSNIIPSRSGGLYLQRTGVLCIQEPTDNYHRKRLFILIELCSEGFENHQRRMNSVPHHRSLLFFFFFNGCMHGIRKFPGPGIESKPQLHLQHSCGNARSLTHCAGLGIEPTPLEPAPTELLQSGS